jgi:two-component system phosphate regulon response regulator PhoB
MLKKVLVVEDDELIRQFLCMTLRLEGYEVIEAVNGDEAIAMAFSQLPDLILLDWMMPGTSGLEVLKAVRAHSATCNIPVVMATAKSEEADLSLSSLEGASAYLSKPFDGTVVSLVVNRFLQNSPNKI